MWFQINVYRLTDGKRMDHLRVDLDTNSETYNDFIDRTKRAVEKFIYEHFDYDNDADDIDPYRYFSDRNNRDYDDVPDFYFIGDNALFNFFDQENFRYVCGDCTSVLFTLDYCLCSLKK